MALLTVSVASALIAAGIAVLQFLLPNALALVLTSALRDSHSAVTWSVVSRFFLSSDWPVFLRSDAATSHRTDRKVSLITYTKPIGLIITAIAAVVTPLGLYEGIYPSSNAQTVTFVYVPDTGPIANGTMIPSPLGYSRTCGYVDQLGASTNYCPHEPDRGNVTYMWYNATYTYSNTTQASYNIEYDPVSVQIRTPQIASSLVDLFQTGLDDKPTLSGFFDIAYREYELESRNYTVDNSSAVQPTFNMPSSYLLENKTILVEGMIADFVNGGIGFRSHSVPVNLPYGAEWEEDILWWTPDVVCVNTNVTLSMVTKSNDQVSSEGIVDRGGFVDLAKHDPFPGSEFYYMDAQKDPRLYDRAYYSAWGANALTMSYLNITQPGTNRSNVDSNVGKFFSVNSTSRFIPSGTGSARQRQFPSISITLDGLVSSPLTTNSTYEDNPALANPNGITSQDYYTFRGYSAQDGSGNPLNISRIDTAITMVAGPTYDKNGAPGTDFGTSGLTYERPTYVCAAATKMSIKKVTFRYNATGQESLSNLEILNITDKVYQNQAEMPLWGMEDYPLDGWNISMISPLWGFVDDSVTTGKNVSAMRSEHFYVPAGMKTASRASIDPSAIGGDSYNFLNNVPAAEAAARLWTTTFGSGSISNAPDYSGKNDARFQNLWINMYRSTTGVANAYKLIWTDYATSYLTGTKGIHTTRYKAPSTAPVRRDAASSTPGSYPVHVLQHRLRYKWVYGIPALLSVGLVGSVIIIALVSCIFGHASVDRLRHYLFSVTSGRVLASFVYPESADDRLQPTRNWIDSVGYKPISVQGQSALEMQPKMSSVYVRIDQKDNSS